MKQRPLPVLLLGCLYVAAGAIGLGYHFPEFQPRHPFALDFLWVFLIRLLALVCGVYLLRGRNWARWLALLWITYHVVLSIFHTWSEVVIHGLLGAAVAFFLFRPPATQYFK